MRRLIQNTAVITHAAVDLGLILVLGPAAVVLDKWDDIKGRRKIDAHPKHQT